MLCEILEPGIDVQCEDEHMQISIERKHFSQLQIGRFHLRYRNCQATGLNQTHMSFRTALNDCGTTHNESESTISYWNEIQAQIVTPGGVISRMHEVSIPFYCVYSKKKLVSGASYKPRRVVFAPEGEGRFIQCDHALFYGEVTPISISGYDKSAQFGEAFIAVFLLRTTSILNPAVIPIAQNEVFGMHGSILLVFTFDLA